MCRFGTWSTRLHHRPPRDRYGAMSGMDHERRARLMLEEIFSRPSRPVTDRAAFVDATDLIEIFGERAGGEAAARADHSRDIGNVLGFCRWRQAARVILLIEDPEMI